MIERIVCQNPDLRLLRLIRLLGDWFAYLAMPKGHALKKRKTIRLRDRRKVSSVWDHSLLREFPMCQVLVPWCETGGKSSIQSAGPGSLQPDQQKADAAAPAPLPAARPAIRERSLQLIHARIPQ